MAYMEFSHGCCVEPFGDLEECDPGDVWLITDEYGLTCEEDNGTVFTCAPHPTTGACCCNVDGLTGEDLLEPTKCYESDAYSFTQPVNVEDHDCQYLHNSVYFF